MRLFLGLFILVLIVFTTSCKKEEVLSPSELIEGKWTITSQTILNSTSPGDGSYLQFNACSSNCSGVDYKASDATTGSFTYTINEAGTVVTIDDQSSDGGSWNATWDVLDLTENEFRITASTGFGNLLVEMSK